MSTPGPFFSPLEERLAGAHPEAALDECRALLDELRVRLQAEAALAQPVRRYQRVVAARLAVDAASEVISQIGSVGANAAANPYSTAPDQLRKLP